jgi:3'-phosphoadenosine 5'-phosphosulfate sulfotransferase (PAPS reductase)/FAD synthetase
MRGIQCHPLYYNGGGQFDVTRRLGCLGCPLKADKGLADFKANPSLVKAWIRAGQVWWDKPRKKPLASAAKFGDVYELFTHNLFFDTYEGFHLAVYGGLFANERIYDEETDEDITDDAEYIRGEPNIDCKQFLERYFNIEF